MIHRALAINSEQDHVGSISCLFQAPRSRAPLEVCRPALFSYGFRPFFLGGAVWSAACIILWIPQFMGELSLYTAYTPLDWHFHEMLYGYVAAVAAGFLLTAIPNWTGRLPICGGPLAALAALWLAGRLVMLCRFNQESHCPR